ncbi:MAG: pyridoxal-phosphate dependent enzyme [Planctomycetaceae bacterium]|nr:pyridoxal-phosphate dependent enzyme [Planctomycetaceae bacterium]
MPLLSIKDLHEAAVRIAPFARQTPVMTSRRIDEWLGCEAFFKCENLQRTGAFKFRGACNAVFSLEDEEAARGVVTHSSGNHGAALAEAARLRGIAAYVVMPANAPPVKRAAVLEYGGIVTECLPTLQAREEAAARIIAETGATLIHPYNDWRIIAGQATAAAELHAEIPDLDVVICPVGGGGLAAGTALATHFLAPACRVVLGEPQAVNDAWQSLQQGRIVPVQAGTTIADGLRTSLGELTFPVLRDHVEQIVTVSEAEIVTALRMLWTRMKLLVEPSSAVAAAAASRARSRLEARRVGIIVSGGNVDLDHLPWTPSSARTGP